MTVDIFAKNQMQSKEHQRQQKLAMIEDWSRSGLSQKQYCLQHNIAYHTFYYWYKRYRTASGDSTEGKSLFVPLQAATFASVAPTELLLPDGRRLLFHQPVSADFLKTLIA
jgi:transposase-like protein